MEFITNWLRVFPLDSARTCPNAVSCVNVIVFGMLAMLRCALVECLALGLSCNLLWGLYVIVALVGLPRRPTLNLVR